MIDPKKVADLNDKIIAGLADVIVGREELKRTLLLSLLASGHVLIEGLPGTGKTKLARTFAELIGGKFKRIQCVSDMLPADITGFYMYAPDSSAKLIEGPIFSNILLADELNRATPRAQAALLEAMQEHQVTIERDTLPLPKLFMVIGTQQQAGSEGTYPLTNVQSDRFLLRRVSGHATRAEEAQIISNIDHIEEPSVHAVTNLTEVEEVREMAKAVYVSPEMVQYITSVTESLHMDPDVALAPSTRGAIALFKCSRVLALLQGREFVIPDDVKYLAVPALEHRIVVRPEAEMDQITPGMILERTLDKMPVPK